MLVDYDLLDLGDLLNADVSYEDSKIVNLNYDIAIKDFHSIDIGEVRGLFVNFEQYSSAEEQAFLASIRKATGKLIGYLRFNEVFVLGSTGLIVDPKHKIIWIGRSLGWTQDRVLKMLDANFSATRVASNRYRIDERELYRGAETLERAELISAPGYQVYGHWLLDVIPRLYVHKYCNSSPSECLLAPRPPLWASDFVSSMGYESQQFRYLTRQSIKFIKQLDVHTLARYGVIFDRRLSTIAWKALTCFLGASILSTYPVSPQPLNKHSSLYVSRASWNKARILSNSSKVADMLAGYDVKTIHPQDYGLSSQMHMFSEADLVLGEDGSGLHNFLYSSQRGILGVISLGRTNLWHAGLAQAKQWRVAYVSAERDMKSDDRFILGEANLRKLITLAGQK